MTTLPSAAPNPAPNPAPTPALDGFEIGEVLGEGGTAVVYRATTLMGAEVALKMLRGHLSPRQRRAFLAECRLHWSVAQHPQVVRLLWAAAPAEGPAWLATELWDCSLADVLRDGDPGATDRGRLALDLVAGLAALHRAGVLHRDVKPANVMCAGGRAALADFGLALVHDEWTRDLAAGSRLYVAPEVLAGSAPTTRSDVYSAAVTVRATLGEHLTPATERVLTRAGSADPRDRPADAATFRDALAAALGGACDAAAAGPEPTRLPGHATGSPGGSSSPHEPGRLPASAGDRPSVARHRAAGRGRPGARDPRRRVAWAVGAGAMLACLPALAFVLPDGPAWRTVTAAGSAGLVAGGTDVAPRPDDPAGPASRGELVVSEQSRRCLTADAGTGTVGLQACDGGTDQRWVLEDASLRNVEARRCLGVVGGRPRDAASVALVPCAPAPARRWRVRNDGGVVVAGTATCLDAWTDDDGRTGLQVYACHGAGAAANQRWSWEPPADPPAPVA